VIEKATPPRTCRILYCGPAASGKSSNLESIRASVPPEYRIPETPNGEGDGFGFRLDAGGLGAWTVSVESARDGGSAGGNAGFPFDAVVFVADSAAARLGDNLGALEALRARLERSCHDPASVPIVIQYNKRDLPGSLPLAELEKLLNPGRLASVAAAASRGEGVRETLRAALGLAVRRLARGAGEASGGEAPAGEARARSPASLQIEPDGRREPLFAERRSPLVVPVRLPRSALERNGSVQLLLQIEVVDGDLPVLG
jgi:hypothetical protein